MAVQMVKMATINLRQNDSGQFVLRRLQEMASLRKDGIACVLVNGAPCEARIEICSHTLGEQIPAADWVRERDKFVVSANELVSDMLRSADDWVTEYARVEAIMLDIQARQKVQGEV